MLYQNGTSLFDKVVVFSAVDIQTGEITPILVKERVTHTMKIKILKTVPGSVDGIKIITYEEGVEYDLPKELADAFILKGYAENLEVGPMEQKVIEPEETKESGDHPERTVDELREIAKSMGIKGYTKLNKEELTQAIHDAAN